MAKREMEINLPGPEAVYYRWVLPPTNVIENFLEKAILPTLRAALRRKSKAKLHAVYVAVLAAREVARALPRDECIWRDRTDRLFSLAYSLLYEAKCTIDEEEATAIANNLDLLLALFLKRRHDVSGIRWVWKEEEEGEEE